MTTAFVVACFVCSYDGSPSNYLVLGAFSTELEASTRCDQWESFLESLSTYDDPDEDDSQAAIMLAAKAIFPHADFESFAYEEDGPIFWSEFGTASLTACPVM